ncbi:MAG: hypothetical protein ACRDSL_23555 [Pseudonocardiaceae bacterium]
MTASDVGHETVSRLEPAADDLATRYPVTPPAELLADVRRQAVGGAGSIVSQA